MGHPYDDYKKIGDADDDKYRYYSIAECRVCGHKAYIAADWTLREYAIEGDTKAAEILKIHEKQGKINHDVDGVL
jgi:hypothetical protein